MTIVVGIVCKDGVVLASDSQVEFSRGVPVKRVNANKICRLLEEYYVAIAGAGTLTFIRKAIREIARHVADRERKEGDCPSTKLQT